MLHVPYIDASTTRKCFSKYFDNKELFEEKLKLVEGAMEIYELNKKLIDFKGIPEELVKNFLEKKF